LEEVAAGARLIEEAPTEEVGVDMEVTAVVADGEGVDSEEAAGVEMIETVGHRRAVVKEIG
jgi:hypothetical protein